MTGTPSLVTWTSSSTKSAPAAAASLNAKSVFSRMPPASGLEVVGPRFDPRPRCPMTARALGKKFSFLRKGPSMCCGATRPLVLGSPLVAVAAVAAAGDAAPWMGTGTTLTTCTAEGAASEGQDLVRLTLVAAAAAAADCGWGGWGCRGLLAACAIAKPDWWCEGSLSTPSRYKALPIDAIPRIWLAMGLTVGAISTGLVWRIVWAKEAAGVSGDASSLRALSLSLCEVARGPTARRFPFRVRLVRGLAPALVHK
mmetsp:Transcript_23438/g.50027  ORF Transcript_23438/g.50027 Transcript_23438/m.50027 type:complete len:255 (+) Transcript_23438:959-1723(+)